MNERSIARRLGDVSRRLGHVRADESPGIDEGLRGVLGDIEHCCAAIAGLSRAEGAALRPQLVGLLAELDELRRRVTRDRDGAAARLEGLARYRSAHAVYSRPPARRAR